MLRKIFLVFAVLFTFSQHAFAQQEAAKVLVVVSVGHEDLFGFGSAIWRIMELKKGGVDVRALFEGESVLYFLGEDIFASREVEVVLSTEPKASFPAPPSRPYTSSVLGAPLIPSTAPINAGAFGKKWRPRTSSTSSSRFPGRLSKVGGKYTFGPPVVTTGEEYFPQLIKDFTAAGIPYTLCSFSATLLGKYDKLKQLGLPLTEDTSTLVGLSPYVKDGYQIIVY